MLIDSTNNLTIEQQMQNPIELIRTYELLEELNSALFSIREEEEFPTKFKDQASKLQDLIDDFAYDLEAFIPDNAFEEEGYSLYKEPRASDEPEIQPEVIPACQVFHREDGLLASDEDLG